MSTPSETVLILWWSFGMFCAGALFAVLLKRPHIVALGGLVLWLLFPALWVGR